MDVRVYPSAAAWLDDVSPLLSSAEAENNLLLGLARRAVEEPDQIPDGQRLWGIADQGTTVGAAVLTPRHNLVLSRQPAAALSALSGALAVSDVTVPGVVGPDEIPYQFAQIWSSRMGVTLRQRMRQRIYACTEVNWPPRADGDFRSAADGDTKPLADWWSAFAREVDSGQQTDDPEGTIRRIIGLGRLFVWTVDDEIVSCAGVTRPTVSGIAVYFVYTPPERRGSEFATSCVAELTNRMLAAGRHFCCLYTDLANPVSNAIYERIGYRPVCDSQWLEFVEDSSPISSTRP